MSETPPAAALTSEGPAPSETAPPEAEDAQPQSPPDEAPSPASPIERVLRTAIAPAKMAGTISLRTADFLLKSWGRRRKAHERTDKAPHAPISPGIALHVAMDEAILVGLQGPDRRLSDDDMERTRAELALGAEMFERRGWLDDPAAYHTRPPVLDEPWLRTARTYTGRTFEHMAFDSGFYPHHEEPGRDRWLSLFPNRIAHAHVLRHPDDQPRPWLVLVHGFGMGYPLTDLNGFKVGRRFKHLGCNLVLPVLPLHGPRRIASFSGDEFLSQDLYNGVLGLAQTVWDIRRILSWIRLQNPTRIGIYGMSLGGYVTSLMATLEDFDMAVAGIPVVDLPQLVRMHSPPWQRSRLDEHDMFGEDTAACFHAVSPLSLPPRVAHDRRFVFAGLGDRLAPPPQAHRLWKHWEEPAINWYHGNHVGFMWSRDVEEFLHTAFVTSGFTEAAPPDHRPT